MSQSAEDARIRSLRPPKDGVDAWRPIGIQLERERSLVGPVPVLTVFLAGGECPFTCVFCDLWRHTLDTPTPEGAIPTQLERALAESSPPDDCRIKLYNASNFFDSRAVPGADLPRIARLLEGFERIIIECHPRLVGESLFRFADDVSGRLEVAMGLETVHPVAMPLLNKRMSKDDYDRATETLAARNISHRAFVLLGAPFVPEREAIDWSVVSAAYAIERGAETVTLIPVRGGNGELERLEKEGTFKPPSLLDVETALERALALPGDAVVQVDLWDLDPLSECENCFGRRKQRLERMNLTGLREASIECSSCGGG